MHLFPLQDAEAIRLRVAAEIARQRQAARRAEARLMAATAMAAPVCALQLSIWGEPVLVCSARPPAPRRPRQAAAAESDMGPGAVASVFALAAAGMEIGRRWFRPSGADTPPGPARVIREGGTVRLVRLQPQDTEEWQERERARRARQRPPKPSKKARTRGEKLLALIGETGGKDGA